MARKSEKPFDKIIATHQRLDMYAKYGEAALQGMTPQELIADAAECFTHLMKFRNMVVRMGALDVPPEEAAQQFMD